MDYDDLIQDHLRSGADCTIGCIPIPLCECDQFGIMRIDEHNRVIDFQEKPKSTEPMPGDPDRCLGSMGIYVFNSHFLFDQLCRDATEPGSQHDFGKNIIPGILKTHHIRAYPFRDKNTGRSAYWRDVGTLDAIYEANMDLITVNPELNLYDKSWPIRTYQPQEPPPKFVFAQLEGVPPRMGHALDSMICSGSILSGGAVKRSILGYNVRVNSYATVEDSILFDGVIVGRHARIRRAIIDKWVHVPEGFEIGYDPDADRRRGFTVTESGITVIGQADGIASADE
jgi:glucose-1-phosphate adenylyltransferase